MLVNPPSVRRGFFNITQLLRQTSLCDPADEVTAVTLPQWHLRLPSSPLRLTRPFGSALLMHVVAALEQMETGRDLKAVAHSPDVSLIRVLCRSTSQHDNRNVSIFSTAVDFFSFFFHILVL